MTRSRWLVLSFVVLIIAANGVAIYWRMSPLTRPVDPLFAPETRLERQRQQLSWEEHAVIVLDSPELLKHAQTIRIDNSIPVPPSGSIVDPDSLTDDQRRALYDTVTSFLRAYYGPKCSAESVLSLMSSLGMALDPVRVGVMRDCLREEGINPDRLTTQDVYRAFWESMEPAMNGLVAEASCVTVWRYTGADTEILRDSNDLAHWVRTLWTGVYMIAPNFLPAEPLSSSQNREILVADCMLIIDNQGVANPGKSPYLLRLVFNEAISKWQPIAQAAILLDGVDGSDHPF